MNSAILNVAAPKPSRKYPILLETKTPLCGWEYVVLFTAPRTGVVVHVIEEGVQGEEGTLGRNPVVGFTCDAFGEDEFEEFKNTVQLSN